MSKQPVAKYRVGLVSVTIWENDGFHSVDISRSYKDANGEWQTTGSFKHEHLLNLAKCLERAETWIGKQVHTN